MSSVLIRPNQIAKAAREQGSRGSYFVQTWGCQMNEEDSEQIGLRLSAIGLERAQSWRDADVVILNTCSVRKKPEDKAFSMLGELVAYKAAKPEMVIGVCGCMAQIRADEIHKRARHVDFVVGTAQIEQIPLLVEESLQSRTFRYETALPERKGAVVTDVPQRRIDRKQMLKAFIPIQYGCDKFCTFCIVPTTRGRERSRPTQDILDEARALAEQGTKEITLLGQTVNSYGKNLADGRVPFSELLWKLSEIEGIERIRYTSPYPRDFKQDLIETIRNAPKVMEHVHLPLQSGDDEVLQSMKRVYTVEKYLEIVSNLRSAIPNIGLTTDIIVGFPGETEKQFEQTLDIVEKVQFDGAYMFIYSPRPGTPAAEMEQISKLEKERRLQRLIELQTTVTRKKNEACVGQEFEVLVEGVSPKNPQMLQGYTRDFRMMHFPGNRNVTGSLISVIAEQAFNWGLKGQIL